MRKKYNSANQMRRRAYQLKYTRIPTREAAVKRYHNLHKAELCKLRLEKRELYDIEASLQEIVSEDTYLESLKKVSKQGKPTGLRIPKSIGGSGR